MTAIGIDFGTSNSVVAEWRSGDVEVLALDTHHLDADWNHKGFEFLFPSVVGRSSLRSGALFGWEAKLRSEEAAEVCKRLLKNDEYVTILGRRYAATTVAAGVFQAMREGAQRNLTDIESAVVTVPANATGAARFRTRTAARFAGIDVRALLNEPTAAAISYAHDIQENSQLLVFDWGGGTIDVTILDYDPDLGFFEEKASRGVTKLGGLELDRRLQNIVLERVPPKTQWSPAQERQFRLDIERAKIRLSTEDSVVVTTPDGRSTEIFPPEFEDAVTDLVDRALEPIEECLEALHMTQRDVDAVLMIGGTSQIPCVRDAVAEVLQTEPVATQLCDPMTAVARGASIAAAILAGRTKGHIAVSTSHALGTMASDAEGNQKFSMILPRYEVLPASGKKGYTPNKDNARELRVEIWEGDQDKDLADDDNVQLAELHLEYPRPRPRDESRFQLEFSYDESGILHVRAELESTGEVVLDEEVKSFSSGGAPPDVRRELDDLSAISTPSSVRTLMPRASPAPARGVVSAVPKPAPPTAPRTPAAAKPVPTGGSASAGTGSEPRQIVVDGSNIAWIGRSPKVRGVYEPDDRPSFAQLTAARAALHARFPKAEVHVVVDATFRHAVSPDERPATDAALSKSELLQPPPGTEGRGDALVAAIAEELGAVIVTNDNYAELQHRYPWLRQSGHVLGATLVAGRWVFEPRVCVPPRRRI